MRCLIPTCLILLLAMLGHAQEKGDKKAEPTPPWATITMGGEIRDLLEVRTKTNVLVLLDRDMRKGTPEYKWDGPPPERVVEPAPKTKPPVAHVRSVQVGKAAWVVVLLDETDSDLDTLLPKLVPPKKDGLLVLVEGRIAAAKDKEPFVAYANAWGKMRSVGENSKGVPATGEIHVLGNVLHGKFEYGKGKTTPLAIENGWSPILVTGKIIEAADAKGTISVTGKLIVQKQGPLVVEATSIGVKK